MIFFTCDNHLERSASCATERWNSVVSDGDVVYIAGDLLSANVKNAQRYLEKLCGRKILILGNNDPFWLHRLSKSEIGKCFHDVTENCVIDIGEFKMEISHYPKKSKCDFSVCGHIHMSKIGISYEILKNSGTCFNAGAMINGGAPVDFLTLVKNNATFYGRNYSDSDLQTFGRVANLLSKTGASKSCY